MILIITVTKESQVQDWIYQYLYPVRNKTNSRIILPSQFYIALCIASLAVNFSGKNLEILDSS